MAAKDPVAEQRFNAEDVRALTTWAEARRRLDEAKTFWLAIVRPDTRPHVMPVLAVWVDGALHFCASDSSHKARNIARNHHCVVTVASDGLDLVVEGDALKVNEQARIERVAQVYASRYGWQAAVRDGPLRRRRTHCGSAAVRRVRAHSEAGLRLRHGRVVERDPLELLAHGFGQTAARSARARNATPCCSSAADAVSST